MKSILKRYFFNFAINPFTYILVAAFEIFVSLKFFIGQQFFLGAGSTDLHNFFSAFPPACILFLPVLVSVSSNVKKDFPLKSIFVFFPEFLSVFFICCFATFLSILVPVCVSFFGDIEISQACVGFIGILFYFAAAVSFTIFIFSIIKSAGVSFVVSAFFLAIINSIHNIPLYFNPPEFLSAIIKFISFAWRFDSFSKGIFSITDFLFFASSAAFFYALAFFIQEDRKENKSVYLKKIKRAFAFSFLLFTIANESLNLKIDFTSSKNFSVSKYSKKILSQIEDPLSISYYLSPKLKSLYPQVKDVTDFLQSYAGESKKVSVEIINPAKENISQKLSEIGIRGYPIRTSSADSASITNVYSAIKIDYLGKSETIPFVLNISRLEFDLTRKIKSLVEEKENPVQVVCASSFANGYKLAFQYLEAEGFSVIQTSLPSEKNSGADISFDELPNIPLIIFGSDNFTKTDCKILENFILNGGKVFIASQPYSIDFEDNWSVKQNESNQLFERLMFTFGIYFKQTLTCDISNLRITMTSNSDVNGNEKAAQTEYINYPLWISLRTQENALSGLSVFWPCAFDIDNEVAEIEKLKTVPLLFTSNRSWQIPRTENFITNPFAVPKTAESEEEYSTFTVCASSTKENEKSPSLILFADQYAFSDSLLSYNSNSIFDVDSRSLDFLCNGIFMLNGEYELLNLKNKTTFNTTLYKISNENIRDAAIKTLFTTCVLPIFTNLTISFIFFSKRRRFNK